MSQAFIAFARAHGVEIDASKLDDSGKLKRCPTTEHPRSRNGAYLFDGRSGWVFAWDGEGRAIGFNDPNSLPLTAAEQAKRDAKRQTVRDEQAHLHRKAAEWASRLLTIAKPAEHDYLHRKGFKTAQGLVLPDGELFIPMRDVRSNELIGAQMVKWLPDELRWEKKYLYGMRSRGAVLRLGARNAMDTVLAEGYATSLSIAAAITMMRVNMAVLCCFSAHNLTSVGRTMKGRVGVFGDNDESGAGQKAAAATGLAYVIPNEVGTDANDLHVRHGLMAVAAKLHELRIAIGQHQEARHEAV